LLKVNEYLKRDENSNCFNINLMVNGSLFYNQLKTTNGNAISTWDTVELYFKKHYGKTLIQEYMEFLIADTVDAYEGKDYFFAELFKNNPNLFFEQYRLYKEADRDILLGGLSFGLGNDNNKEFLRLFNNEIRRVEHAKYENELSDIVKELNDFYTTLKLNERTMELGESLQYDIDKYHLCVQALITLKEGMVKYKDINGKYTSDMNDLGAYLIPECEHKKDCDIKILDWMKQLPNPGECKDIRMIIINDGADYQIKGTALDSFSCNICITKRGFFPQRYNNENCKQMVCK